MTSSTFTLFDEVTVRRIVYPAAPSHQPDPPYRMFIAPVDQPTHGIRIPYAPVEVTHSHGAEYADVDRVGRKPLLVYKNPKRKEMSFTLTVADRYVAVPGSPTTPHLNVSAKYIATTLMNWANGGTRLRVTYGYFENNNWRITDISTRSLKRSSTSNEFTHAEISLTFTEVQDVKVGTGPVSGGVKPAPSKVTPAPKTRTYVVKKGDTLSKISIKFYGTAAKWRKIADANKLKNPNRIFPGQKLKIP